RHVRSGKLMALRVTGPPAPFRRPARPGERHLSGFAPYRSGGYSISQRRRWTQVVCGGLCMLKKSLRWMWTHPRSTAGLLLALAAILLNTIAYMHAHAMTHFTPDGARTVSPESLSALEKVGVLCIGVRIPKPSSDLTPDRFGLAYERLRLQTKDGIELDAWHIPHPKPRGIVLLFH